ncbi:MAG: hypothetical protein JXB60_02835 [Candidatus Cloacimonetes bacterium]|nr:hypothetical protein [Candidatus Cloacimonadota bacterium]
MKRIAVLLAVMAMFMLNLSLYCEDDFETWNKEQSQEFQSYKESQNKAFAEFLKKQWESFELYKAEYFDQTPKPETAPVAEEEVLQEVPSADIIENIVVPKKIELVEEEAEEKNFMAVVPVAEEADLIIDYWGEPLKLKYLNRFIFQLHTPVNYKEIAEFWNIASDTEYEKLIEQLQAYKKKIGLNDWGYCLLINEISKNLTGNSANETKLLVWFLLTQSGFDTKVAYSQDNVYLMMTSGNKIFGVPYLRFGEKRFYVVSLGEPEKISGSIYTFNGSYPDADREIDLTINNMPNLKPSLIEKELSFEYGGKRYIMKIQHNQNNAKYLDDYPQTNLEIYFGAPLSNEAYRSLSSQLKPLLEGKPQAEAVNILLRFVQTAFAYKTDGEQFGKEKSLFSDETFFYPYCDCEDRSILFAFLVRNILGLQVIGLDYPGHIATAVRLDSYFKGYAVKYQNERYLICDPTYINANIGMVMPQFKGERPKLIKI